MTHDVAVALMALGTAVIVASALGGLLRRRDVFVQLHFVTPITSLGAPLVGIGLMVENGWGLTSAEILLVLALLFGSGPVLAAATGRTAAERAGHVGGSTPP